MRRHRLNSGHSGYWNKMQIKVLLPAPCLSGPVSSSWVHISHVSGHWEKEWGCWSKGVTLGHKSAKIGSGGYTGLREHPGCSHPPRFDCVTLHIQRCVGVHSCLAQV